MCSGKGSAAAAAGHDVTGHLSLRQNSALSCGSRDSPFTSSRDSIHRSITDETDNDRMLRAIPAAGSDVIA